MIGCIWLVLWVIYLSNEPEDHKWISEAEKNHIEDNISVKSCYRKPPVPWIAILTSMPVIATIISKFTVMWNYLLFMLKLPAYLNTVFNISGTEVNLLDFYPNISMFDHSNDMIYAYFLTLNRMGSLRRW